MKISDQVSPRMIDIDSVQKKRYLTNKSTNNVRQIPPSSIKLLTHLFIEKNGPPRTRNLQIPKEPRTQRLNGEL